MTPEPFSFTDGGRASSEGATPYLFRSGFNAGIAFAEDCRPQDYPRDLLKEAIAEGKRLRKYWFGNFYPLTDVTTNAEDWCVMRYENPSLIRECRRS